jgi:hypothetical protein
VSIEGYQTRRLLRSDSKIRISSTSSVFHVCSNRGLTLGDRAFRASVDAAGSDFGVKEGLEGLTGAIVSDPISPSGSR